MEKELVVVIDFGGQYNQLVARRVRECSVYCEIYSYKTDLEKIKAMNPKGIIHGGSCVGDLLWGPADDSCSGWQGGAGRRAGIRQDGGTGGHEFSVVSGSIPSHGLLDESF